MTVDASAPAMADCSLAAGLRLVVTVDGGALATELVAALSDHGALFATVSLSSSGKGDAQAAIAKAAEGWDGIDALIHAAPLPPDAKLATIAEMDAEAWIAHSEGPVKRQLWLFQAAYPFLKQRRGRIVVVQPNFGISGMIGATALGAAVEGQRILAKIAARQWGKEGISANALLVSPELLLPGIDPALVRKMAEAATGFLPPSLRPIGGTDVRRDIAPVVAFLASPGGGLVTGQTIVADGGSWMVP
ncbi:SDR family NAD(P)-dependent oxidoreductase [soil metagenome]